MFINFIGGRLDKHCVPYVPEGWDDVCYVEAAGEHYVITHSVRKDQGVRSSELESLTVEHINEIDTRLGQVRTLPSRQGADGTWLVYADTPGQALIAVVGQVTGRAVVPATGAVDVSEYVDTLAPGGVSAFDLIGI